MNNSKVTILLKQLAKLHLREQDPEEAAKRLSRLLELNPTNKKFLAQLIIAYTQVKICNYVFVFEIMQY